MMEKTCQKIQEQILELITGALSAEKAADLERHISSCPACSEYLQGLQADDKLLGDFAEAMQPRVARLENNVIDALERAPSSKPVSTISIWRTIMKSRITKVAAAAAIIIGVLLVLNYVGSPGPTGVAYGISDVPGLLRSAKTLHIKGSHVYHIKGQEPISCPVEYWMDFENLCYRERRVYRRMRSEGGFADSFGEQEVVFDPSYIMVIDHVNKTVRFGRHTPFRSRRLLRAYMERDIFLRDFYLESDQLDGFEKTGQEEIESGLFDIWEKKKQDRMVARYWLNPRTGELGQYYHSFLYDRYLKAERKMVRDKYCDPYVLLDEDKQEWHEHFLTCIERDKLLPKDVFKIEAPSDYTVTKSIEDAGVPGEIGYTTFPPTMPNMTVSLCYTLSEDGSVIMAWSDRNGESLESQAGIFEALEPGGPLPELTFVPYALHPLFSVFREKNESITYVGCHLAYTKKGNIYYEWSIYIPDSDPPESEFKHKLTYDALVRRNPDDGQIRGLGLIPDTIITSSEEFDAFVLGGMAELSDDGKAPEGITYESVLQLAQQIRETLGN